MDWCSVGWQFHHLLAFTFNGIYFGKPFSNEKKPGEDPLLAKKTKPGYAESPNNRKKIIACDRM